MGVLFSLKLQANKAYPIILDVSRLHENPMTFHLKKHLEVREDLPYLP